jgi:Phosphate-selective porin O and P
MICFAPWMRRLPVLVFVAALFALWRPTVARGVERNFAGSMQIDYQIAPERERAKQNVFDGATLEASLKLSVDVSEHLSANVKVCISCHGFETDMAYLDYRLKDEFNVRAGRFSPSFGNFNLRHDVANHKFSDKPLVYDMGRMLRLRDWNLGVLPSPFPDNGIELNGLTWLSKKTQLDYAVYAVSGFKADVGALDLDFQQSRSGNLYYVDNNWVPTVGARVAVTSRLAKSTDFTLGGSGMFGYYDPKRELSYGVFGVDFSTRIKKTNIRAEYLLRRQQFDTSDPARFKYELKDDYFVKHGGFLEIEHPLGSKVELLVRGDAMFRSGNVAAASPLGARARIFRGSVGALFSIERAFRIKTSLEYWNFSEGEPHAVTGHLAFVGTL